MLCFVGMFNCNFIIANLSLSSETVKSLKIVQHFDYAMTKRAMVGVFVIRGVAVSDSYVT